MKRQKRRKKKKMLVNVISFEVLTAVKMSILVFCVVTPFLRNVGISLLDHTALRPRTPTSAVRPRCTFKVTRHAHPPTHTHTSAGGQQYWITSTLVFARVPVSFVQGLWWSTFRGCFRFHVGLIYWGLSLQTVCFQEVQHSYNKNKKNNVSFCHPLNNW
jgi:hypothetical protein